ncbi:MAG: 5-formyltetrahydrofolate cyclo-ligase [Acidobacteria bacterium]|nr:5-formyltetrahydrofolate cyclo-ligase [Acidobacteriota bacterium]
MRKEFRGRRSRLSAAEAAVMARDTADRFFATIDLDRVRGVHTFISIRDLNEIDTSAIYFRLWRDHPEIRTFAPRMELDSGEISSVEFDSATEMIVNRWGIREPAGPASQAEDLDIVLVPLLCFDRSGHRVGYGGGYYDRFLTKVRPDCLKLGLCFFPPVPMISDVTERDVRLDAAITPTALFRF